MKVAILTIFLSVPLGALITSQCCTMITTISKLFITANRNSVPIKQKLSIPLTPAPGNL